jgi:hypothetical protein
MEEISASMTAAGLPGGFHEAAAEIFRRTPRARTQSAAAGAASAGPASMTAGGAAAGDAAAATTADDGDGDGQSIGAVLAALRRR